MSEKIFLNETNYCNHSNIFQSDAIGDEKMRAARKNFLLYFLAYQIIAPALLSETPDQPAYMQILEAYRINMN